MYRYLDRPVASLASQDQFLVLAMRSWVAAARAGRCTCHNLRAGFQRQGIVGATQDFGILMMTLDRDAVGQLTFGACGCATTTSDEARLLALFATAREGPLTRLRRVAATFVTEDAISRLAQATDFVATALATTNPADIQ